MLFGFQAQNLSFRKIVNHKNKNINFREIDWFNLWQETKQTDCQGLEDPVGMKIIVKLVNFCQKN